MRTDPSPGCPKCGHARAPDSLAPDRQCPNCGIACQKYAAWLARSRQAFTPPRAGEPAPRLIVDGSAWALVGANVLTLALAWYHDWVAAQLMLIFWVQSTLIGCSYLARILSLERFSTEGMLVNDQPVAATPQTRAKVAAFFAVHYGGAHVTYLLFLVVVFHVETVIDPWLGVSVFVYTLNHLFSFEYNRALDRQGEPNIGKLMATPYIRILPMHLTIILGAMIAGSPYVLLLFGLLKTIADVAMHAVEHQLLRKPAPRRT